MSEEELKGATKATKEAARAFAASAGTGVVEEEEVVEGEHEDVSSRSEERIEEELIIDDVRLAPSSPTPSSTASTIAAYTNDVEVFGSSTPTQQSHNQSSLVHCSPDSRSNAPPTPPQTPRRYVRPTILFPGSPESPHRTPSAKSTQLSSGFSSGSNTSMSPCGSEESCMASDDSFGGSSHQVNQLDGSTRYVTPPPTYPRNGFGSIPPTPTSPHSSPTAALPRRIHRSATTSAPVPIGSTTSSPNRASPRLAQPPRRPTRSLARRRHQSFDSSEDGGTSSSTSNSSSSIFSQPPTPVDHCFPQHSTRAHAIAQQQQQQQYYQSQQGVEQSAKVDQVRIVSSMEDFRTQPPIIMLNRDGDEDVEMIDGVIDGGAEGSAYTTTTKDSYTAYYPLFGDRDDLILSQERHYSYAASTPASMVLPTSSRNIGRGSKQKARSMFDLSSVHATGIRR